MGTMEKMIRRIVREEIARAFRVGAQLSDDPYDDAINRAAMSVTRQVLTQTALAVELPACEDCAHIAHYAYGCLGVSHQGTEEYATRCSCASTNETTCPA